MPTEHERQGSQKNNSGDFMSQLRTVSDKIGERIARFRDVMDHHPVSPLLYVTIAAVAIGSIVFGGQIQAHAKAADLPNIAVSLSETASEAPEMNDVQKAYAAGLPGGKPVITMEDAAAPAAAPAAEEPDSAPAVEPQADTVFALVVEDEVVGYTETEEALYKILDDVAQPWITPDTIRYDFVESVEIAEVSLPAGAHCDEAAIIEKLSSLRTERAVYTVVAGDTFNSIAINKLHMNPDELAALNPTVDVNVLYAGDELTYQQPVPFLSVLCLTDETYQAVVKSPVEYIGTPDLYVGNTKLKTQGADGLSVISAQVTYCNGVEQERTIIASEVLKEAVPTEMWSGTTPRPATASNGYYIWPVYGQITSWFGWRNLWGYSDFHTGLDIACAYGTPIKAADGGTVIYAGWQGSYGLLVGIRHDNGSETYYAHCSSIAVSVGQKVYQGQVISYVGLTGNTSGPHCHFEVRINGTRVNPLNYLS